MIYEGSCAETIQTLVEGVLGQEGDAPPPVRTLEDGERGQGGSRIND